MPTRKLFLAAVFLVGLVALGWRLLHLYGVPRPYDALLPETRSFLERALVQDSAGLARLGVSAAAAQWALETARKHPMVLQDLLRGLSVGGGRRVGEGYLVLFHGSSRGICLNRPLAVTFAGTLTDARIQSASTDCVRP